MLCRSLRRFRVWLTVAARDLIFQAIVLLALIFVATTAVTQPTAFKSIETQSFIETTIADPVAFFTFILSISTIGLWLVTWRSSSQMTPQKYPRKRPA